MAEKSNETNKKEINEPEMVSNDNDEKVNNQENQENQEEKAVETAEETDTTTSEKADKEEKESKGFFKKKDKKDKKDEKIDELTDRLMRTMAEFENFRRRSEKEKSQMFEVGAKDVIEKILPIVDNFERGLNALSEEEKEEKFAQGILLIYKQLMTSLESVGVKPIEAVGKEFDPNFHNAVMHEEDETLGENIVKEELQKGYMYRDSVVRHSMVKVVN